MKLNSQTKISLVSGACLIGLVVILKNVLLVPADILSNDIITYIIVFSIFGWLPGFPGFPGFYSEEKIKKSKYDSPLYWSLFIILITTAIIALYAL